jgi:hypothetical protein
MCKHLLFYKNWYTGINAKQCIHETNQSWWKCYPPKEYNHKYRPAWQQKYSLGNFYGHVFDEEALRLFERLCVVGKVKHDVTAEKQWILKWNDDLSHGLKASVIDCLTNNQPHKDIAVHEGFAVPVNLLSYFTDEWYIDNFTIDFMLAKYYSESKNKSQVLCLPSHCKYIIEANNEKRLNEVVESCTIQCDPSRSAHLSACHWGLIIINVFFKVYFDDGMKCKPPFLG